MANSFTFVGKIFACKETDNFKPHEKRTFESGWTKESIKFNAVCGSNRHMVEQSVLYPKNKEDVTIYTLVKREGDEKAHNETVPYDDRFDAEILAAVPQFKKFVLDSELPNRRKELKSALTAFEDGTITDETMTKLGIMSIEDCKTAYDKSCKKRHEFIWEGDFIEYLAKFLTNDKVKDYVWRITGDYALEYNSENDQWYRKFKVQKIYRAEDDAEITSQASFVVTFGREAVDDTDYTETKKLHINGFITQYLGKPYKKNCFCPMTFTIDGSADEQAEKKAKFLKDKFTFPAESEADYREYGIVCDVLDGAQVVEFTEDMMNDEERENVELGFSTFEDIKRAHNSKEIYGDKVTDIVIVKPLGDYRSSGAVDTAYAAEDVGKPRCDLDEPKYEEVKVFDDVDDDDEI